MFFFLTYTIAIQLLRFLLDTTESLSCRLGNSTPVYWVGGMKLKSYWHINERTHLVVRRAIMRVWTTERRTYCTKKPTLRLFWHQPAAGRQSGNERLRIHWKGQSKWNHCLTVLHVKRSDHIFPVPEWWPAFHRHKQDNVGICLFLFKCICNHFWPGSVITLCAPTSQVKWIQALHLFWHFKK